METKAREFYAVQLIGSEAGHYIASQDKEFIDRIRSKDGIPFKVIEYSAYEKLEAENKKLREALSNFSNPDFYWNRKQVDHGNGWITLGKSKTHEELAEYAKKALGEGRE